ncbi:uncharacterized protein LOC135825748 [Sycon ciliatum]|uniref:uncharacterized protein LOC135825748 n=1 Tax=Sycon ciliatum TaxID=27933 RepID=UPI0031F651D7
MASRDHTGSTTDSAHVAGDCQDPETDGSLPEAVRRLKDLLVHRYRGATADLGEGMVDSGVAEPGVADVHVNLIILSRPDLRQEFENPRFDSSEDMWRVEHVFTRAAESLENISLENLFNLEERQEVVFCSGGRTYRILVVASAGCGKTFVFTKVAPYKWAMKEMWNQFDLVLSRKLRHKEVRKAKSVCALFGVEELGEFSGEERRVIDDFVRQNPHRVCVLLDGLDETRVSECSGFVCGVINGEQLDGIRLVVTSRPCVDVLSLSSKKQFDRRVELVGFRQDDVEDYIGKVLKAPEEAAALVAAVRDDPHLGSMMATPFLAMQTCKLFHCRNGTLPRCITDIFDMMIIQVAERHTGEVYASWSEIPSAVRDLVLDLGAVAFSMLEKQRLIFTDADLVQHSIATEAKALGLLVLADTTTREDSKLWMFSHLTMQESLSARYVGVRRATSLRRVVQDVKALGPTTGHLRTFWMLLTAQLDVEKAECLINGLLTREHVASYSWANRKYVESRLDSDNEDDDLLHSSATQVFPLDMLEALCCDLNDHDVRRLSEELLFEALDGGSGSRLVEKRCKNGRLASNEEFLKTLLLTWVEICPDSTRTSIATALNYMGKSDLAATITAFTLVDLPSALPHYHKKIAFVDRSRLDLSVLCYAEYARHHGNSSDYCISSIAAALESNFAQIDFGGHPAIVRAYNLALAQHPSSVHRLDIDFQPDSPCSLIDGLPQLTAIADLEVGSCTCAWQWEKITSIITSSKHNMRNVFMRRCHLGVSTVPSDPVSPQLAQDTSTGSVSTSRDGGHSPASLLADALADVPHLQSLELLNCSHFKSDDVQLIYEALGNSHHLLKLRFSEPLQSHFLPTLACNLSSKWNALRELQVSLIVVDPLAAEQLSMLLHAISEHKSLITLLLSVYEDTDVSKYSAVQDILRGYMAPPRLNYFLRYFKSRLSGWVRC